ncbi:integrase arm-type DNA-binding domain-containing protein [Bradyrhizobium sp. LMG 9283]|uniref:integrase arm-type DNA-binding domain-containing protein n=1 Tax=Bradyrhizobium sp. LMG 9283 TaxID=592064 RepID=UPI00388D7054
MFEKPFAIGDASEMSTRAARATAKEYLAQISRGRHPKDERQTKRMSPAPAMPIGAAVANITLRQAWDRYLDAHLIRKNRSEKTIEGYRDHVERVFAE